MAPTQTIQLGVPLVLTEDLAYGVPISFCYGAVTPASAAMEGSNNGSTWESLTLTDGQFSIAYKFIRSTDADVILRLVSPK